MKLVICSRDVDETLVKGDLISWHDEAEFEGRYVGLHNAVSNGLGKDEYLNSHPFTILILPLITYEDIRVIIEDVDIDTGIRKWKIDDSSLEQRGQGSVYSDEDNMPTKLRWEEVFAPPIRRDTLRAYREISRSDIVIADILVAR